MRPFKRGTWLMMSRALCPVLPVAIEGAYDAWPRTRTLPSLWGKRIRVKIGEPVDHDRLLAMGPDAGLRFLAAEIDAMRLELRAELRRDTGGRYPAPGPGDRGMAPVQEGEAAEAVGGAVPRGGEA
jgi:1-acyl-sn-glycerol-3-phosphate acyltransferase